MGSQSIIITGARCFVYINNKRFGRCTAFSWVSLTPTRDVETVDTPIPAELAPTRQRVQVSMSLLRTVADGGLEGRGMVPRGEQLPEGQYCSVALVERLTDTVLFQADFCTVEQQAWNVVAHGRMEGQASLKAITWNNEVSSK